MMVQYGGAGRHVAALDLTVVITWLKLDVAAGFVYNVSIALPKLAILCLYGRVFTTKIYRYAIYLVGSIVTVTCIAGLIVAVAICQPFAYFWDKSIANGHCGDIAVAYRYISVPNLVTDVLILVLPLNGVWRLQTKVIHKIGLTLTFLTGCV